MRNFLFLLLIIWFFNSCSGQKANYSKITEYKNQTSNMMVEYIPDSIFEMGNLKILSIIGMDFDYILLDENGEIIKDCWMIKEIPPEIENLKNLEYLDLSVNSINVVPVEIKELKKLKVLNLSDNPGLEDVNSLAKVVSLEELYLYGCNLESFPKELGLLKKLKKLGLTGNRLQESEKERIRKELTNCEIGF